MIQSFFWFSLHITVLLKKRRVIEALRFLTSEYKGWVLNFLKKHNVVHTPLQLDVKKLPMKKIPNYMPLDFKSYIY